MNRMVTAKEFLWEEIIEEGLDIDTFNECYNALSLVIPKDWEAIPREIFNVFDGTINNFPWQVLKSQYSIEGYVPNAFCIYLIQSGKGISKDGVSWSETLLIKRKIEVMNSLLDSITKHIEELEDLSLLDEFLNKKEVLEFQLEKARQQYKESFTLKELVLSDGRTLRIGDDWYIFN